MTDIAALNQIGSVLANSRMSRKDLALQTLMSAGYTGDLSKIPDVTGTGTSKGPSVIHRVLDILSRANYASANIAENLTGHGQHKNVFSEAWAGLSGKEKTTYSDVFKKTGFIQNAPLLRGIAGFAADVALDPTTYIPGAAVLKGIKGLTVAGKFAPKLAEGLKGADEAIHAIGNSGAKVTEHPAIAPGRPFAATEGISTAPLRPGTEATGQTTLFGKKGFQVPKGKVVKAAEEITPPVGPLGTVNDLVMFNKRTLAPTRLATAAPLAKLGKAPITQAVLKIPTAPIKAAAPIAESVTTKAPIKAPAILKQVDETLQTDLNRVIAKDQPVMGVIPIERTPQQMGLLRQINDVKKANSWGNPTVVNTASNRMVKNKVISMEQAHAINKATKPSQVSDILFKGTEQSHGILPEIQDLAQKHGVDLSTAKTEKEVRQRLALAIQNRMKPTVVSPATDSHAVKQMNAAAEVAHLDSTLNTVQHAAVSSEQVVKEGEAATKHALDEAAPMRRSAKEQVNTVLKSSADEAASKASNAAEREARKIQSQEILDSGGQGIVAKRLAAIKKPPRPGYKPLYHAPNQAQAYNDSVRLAFKATGKAFNATKPESNFWAPHVVKRVIDTQRAVEDGLEAAGFPAISSSGKPLKFSDVMQRVVDHVNQTYPEMNAGERASLAQKIWSKDPVTGHDITPSQIVDAIADGKSLKEGILNDMLQRGEFKNLGLDSARKILVTGQHTAEATAETVAEIGIKESDPVTKIAAEHAPSVAEKAATETAGPAAGAISHVQTEKILKTAMAAKTASDEIAQEAAVRSTKEGFRKGPNLIKDNFKNLDDVHKMDKIEQGLTNTEILDQTLKDPLSTAIPKSMMGRVASWLIPSYGAKFAHSIIIDNRSFLQNQGERIINAKLNTMAKDFNLAELRDGLAVAQGKAVASTDKVQQAANEFNQFLENLMGSTRIQKDIKVGAKGISIQKSGVLPSELNSWMKNAGIPQHKFSTDMIDPLTKKPIKIENAFHAWQYHDIGEMNPLEYLARMTKAVHGAMVEKTTMQDLIARFGSKVKSGDFNTLVNHPRLAGVYFPKEIASEVPFLLKTLDEMKNLGKTHPLVKGIDQVSARLKAQALASPTYHIHNFIGDMMMEWFAGGRFWNPKTHKQVQQLMMHARNNYSDAASLFDPEHAAQLLKSGGGDAQKFLQLKNGTWLSKDQVWHLANRRGVLPTVATMTDVQIGLNPLENVLDAARGVTGQRSLMSPTGGRVARKVRQVSQTREHYVRLHHFMEKMKTETGSLDEVAQKAGDSVRKWHPTGLDLTKQEREYGRRIFWFYAWTRKAVPLTVEAILFNPGKVSVYPKAMQNLQDAMGVDTPSRSDPFPVDKMVPDWLRDLPFGPITKGGVALDPGGQMSPAVSLITQLGNPIQQGFEQRSVTEGLRGFAGGLSPVAKVPMELFTGRQAQMKADIGSNYIDKTIPALGIASRLTNKNISTEKYINMLTGKQPNPLAPQTTGPFNTQKVINYMLAAGMINEYQPNYQSQAMSDEAKRVRKMGF